MQLTCNWLLAAATLTGLYGCAQAAEGPYVVTYTHHLEEPGNLELALGQTAGSPRGGNPFVSSLLEFEYGVKAWWTTEFYLAGQATGHESTLFTGYRIENRFRPIMGEHWINPVLYFEFEDLNGADKSLKEVVGHDGLGDQLEPNSLTRQERKHEIETKLILSSNFRGWNVAENFIAEKNLAHEPWEFGYALGISRPLALAASPLNCRFCLENFVAGAELFGGLGTFSQFGLRDTSHYLAPVLAWNLPDGTTFHFSPAFGLNTNSHGALFRFGVSYEVSQIGRKLSRLYNGRQD